MPCFHPLLAFQCADGQVVFHENKRFDIVRTLDLSCGQCYGCRLERSRQWAVRCVHEASLHEQNCFITLTYAAEHLPVNGSLVYSDFQRFMKRLRKRFFSVRFFCAGEYGEKDGRPHFHACLFGMDFPDKVYFKKSPSGEKLYRSAVLEDLWPVGFSTIGAVTFESAAYVARYVMKKLTGDGEKEYHIVDPSTGEVWKRAKEFCHMSRRDGIGKDWLRLYAQDVMTNGTVVVRGKEAGAPKFYRRYFKRTDAPAEWERKATALAQRYCADRTPERLAVRERVAISRGSIFGRKL